MAFIVTIAYALALSQVAPASGAAFSAVAIMVFDDTFGHQAGDLALQAAGALVAACREGDLVYRYGGEEFAIIYSDLAPDDAMSAAERVRAEVEALPVGGGLLPDSLTVSVGIAFLAAPERARPESVLAAADVALYEAKTTGRNRVAAAS